MPVIVVLNIKQDAPAGSVEPVAQAGGFTCAPVGKVRTPGKRGLQESSQIRREAELVRPLGSFDLGVRETRVEFNVVGGLARLYHTEVIRYTAKLLNQTAPVRHPTVRPSVTRLRPERLLSYNAASAASNKLSFRPGVLVTARFKEQKPKLAVTDNGWAALMKGA